MRLTRFFFCGIFAGGIVACAVVAHAAQGQPAHETARRQYESGRAFLRDGRHAEALRDFEAVVQLFPTADVADDALLAIADLQLTALGDPAAAGIRLDQLLKQYPSGTAAPMAFVLLGQVQLAGSPGAAALDSALASFDRVRRLFPESSAVPAAAYHAGEALRSRDRIAEALTRYDRVLAESPRTVWAARALLGAAQCHVLQGRPHDAVADLQRIRTRFPDTDEAARALAWNSILNRLYLRPPVKAPFGYAGQPITGGANPLKDVRALALSGATFLVTTDGGVRTFDGDGKEGRAIAAKDPRKVVIDRSGQVLVVTKTGLLQRDGRFTTLSVRRPDGAPKPLDSLHAAVMLRDGTVLVADRDEGVVFRLDRQLALQGPFATARPVRLAVGPTDLVAMLDAESKSVAVFTPDGAVRYRIAQRSAAYRIEDPMDVAFDALGFVYVLDRDPGAVHVFDPTGKFLLTFVVPEQSPGAFRRPTALALDAVGRLFVADDRAAGILVFR